MSAHRFNRREFLKVGGTLGVGLAMPTIVSSRGMAQAGTQNVRFQLSYVPNNNQIGHVVAQKLGYFEEEKLSLSIIAGGPQLDGIPVVAAGGADIGVTSSSPSLMVAVSQKIPVKAFVVAVQQHPYTYYSRPSKPIRTPKDMIGKRIGVPQTGKILLSALLRKNGIPEDQVQTVIIGADMTPLMTGQADAVTNWATQTTALRPLGKDVIAMRLWDFGVQLYGQVYFARPDTIAKKPEMVAGFTRAVARGWGYTQQNPEKALEMFVSAYTNNVLADEKEALPVLMKYMFNENTKKNGWGAFDPAVWQDQIDLYNDLGQFTAGKPKLEDVETTEILEATKDARPKIG